MKSYVLTLEGSDWKLKCQRTHMEIQRFGCREQALGESLDFVHRTGSSLVLIPPPRQVRARR